MFSHPTTLGDMLRRWAEETPDAPALISPDGLVRFADLLETVQSVSACLRDLGFDPGDRLGIASTRRPELVVLFLAASEANLAVLPLNPNRSPDEMRLLCAGLRVKAIAWEAAFRKSVDLALDGRRSIALDVSERGSISYEELASFRDSRAPQAASVDDVPYLNLTSGTTGEPKAALTSQRTLYWNTRSTVEALGFQQDEPFLCLFSSHGHPHELFCRPLFVGAPAVLEPSTSARRIAASMEQNAVRCVMAVPSLYGVLAQAFSEKPFTKPLRLLEAGGAPSDAGLIARVKSCFGVDLCPVWGSTETAGVALATPLGTQAVPDAVGVPCPHYDIQLQPDGEMVILGEGLYQAYARPDGSVEPREGPHRTGDLFRRDEEGWFRFLGRQSAVIKVSGEKVHPERIEAVLAEHPSVSAAAIVGMTHRSKGSVPIAFVVCAGSERPKSAEMRRYCRDRLTPQETPKRFFWEDQLPRLSSGKIDRIRLEALAKERVDESRDPGLSAAKSGP